MISGNISESMGLLSGSTFVDPAVQQKHHVYRGNIV